MTRPSLLLVGCGKMGYALLQGWLNGDVAHHITVVDPSPPASNYNPGMISIYQNAEEIPAESTFAAIIIAIKPQQMVPAVLQSYRRFAGSLYLSIAAGKTLAALGAMLGTDQPIARAMPNLPASIGQGIAALTANSMVAPDQRALADRLMRAVGETVWLENESLMDAVTALSGSGPAYLFALTESMAKAGELLGLPPALAQRLAQVTVTGSATLMERSNLGARALREAVTSPGGTTEAALKILCDTDHGLDPLLQKTMQAALKRGQNLAAANE